MTDGYVFAHHVGHVGRDHHDAEQVPRGIIVIDANLSGAVQDIAHGQILIQAAFPREGEDAGNAIGFFGIRRAAHRHPGDGRGHEIQIVGVAIADDQRIGEVLRVKAVAVEEGAIGVRPGRHVANDVIALAVGEVVAVGADVGDARVRLHAVGRPRRRRGSHAGVMHPHALHRVAVNIQHPPADGEGRRLAHGDDDQAAAHAALHVGHFATHHEISIGGEGFYCGSLVESEGVIAKIPAIGHRIAIGILRGRREADRAAVRDAGGAGLQGDGGRLVPRKRPDLRDDINPFVPRVRPAPAGHGRQENLRGGIIHGASDEQGHIVLVVGAGRSQVEQRADAIVFVADFQPVGEPRVVGIALPVVDPIVPQVILVEAVGVEAAVKNFRRVEGVDPVGRARGHVLHEHIREPVHAVLVHHAEVAGTAAHHVVRVAIVLHRPAGTTGEERRVDVVVADETVRINGMRRAVRGLHGAGAGGHIPELRVRQAEVVAQLMGNRAGRGVKQTIGAPTEAHLRQRVEQHVIFPVILVKISHRGRHHARVGADCRHILPVVIGPLRQANRRRDGRFPMHRAVGTLEEILVVGLQRGLGLIEGLRHARVIRVEHRHVEQLLDALGLAAGHRRQMLPAVRRRREGRPRGRQVLVHGLELLVEGDGMGNLAERIVASLKLDERPAVLHVHRLLGDAARRFLRGLEFTGCCQVPRFVRGHVTPRLSARHEVADGLRLFCFGGKRIGGDLARLRDSDAVQEDAIL